MKNFQSLIIKHKVISVIVALVVIGAGYGTYKHFAKAKTVTTYTLGTVTTGSIISTVTGSGQVSASNSFDLTTKTSGELIVLNANVGQQVKKGALIAEVDPGTAGLALENAKLSYDNKFTVDPTNLLQDQDALASASSSLTASYNSGVSEVTAAYSSMGDVLNSLKALYVSSGYLSPANVSSYSPSAREYSEDANDTYYDAVNAVSQNVLSFQSSDKSSPDAIKASLANAKSAADKVVIAATNAQKAADAIRTSGNDTAKDESARTSIGALVTSANGIDSDIVSSTSDISNSESALVEKQNDLATLQSGPDAVDASSAKLSLAEEEESYDDYFTYAPFDGVLGTLDVNKGDTVSSGATIGTFITQNQVAEITLNEVDVSKIKVGDKATLTFDAVDGLTITGEVAEVDLVGTVSQGVVSYKVKIGFDTQDDRVKSGMSVDASIITDSRQDVLTVPTSAIKTNGDTSYVQLPTGSSTPPTEQEVTTGLSDDTSTEITLGLTEGEQIIVKTNTITATKTTTAASATSLLGGARTGGAAAGRVGAGAGGGFTR